ncbi:olfactory receptor 52D1-like [Thunnus albacares]|uniref:olfactory receptor 52D1-like n=1 Tax=Thunnus albacares TaxID=8236 RepID=UPI001CF70562|nr:olfactory receptor 52D1-like [Thunnus albacares]
MDNLYNTSSVLVLNGFNLSSESVFPAFLFATLSYMIILFCNLILILTIVLNKCLHQPMYLILLNLPVNDLIGSSALFPQVIKEILTNSKTMQYSTCVAQAFFIHIYAAGTVFILSAMAYDRYIAICCPLKYNTVMTNAHIMRIITIVWMSSLIMIGVLFFLLLRLPRCRSVMTHTYCDNPSLLTLVCADTTINNIYGLFLVALSQVISNGTVLYTYLQILVACFRSKRSDTKAKALQTCATHLIVFLLLECLGLFTIISYRIKNISPHLRRFIGLSTLIFPPTLNPIIYGLKTKEIRERFLKIQRIYPEHAEAMEGAEALKAAETIEGAETLEAAETLKGAETMKGAGMLEATEVLEAAQMLEAAETLEAAEALEAAETLEHAETLEAAETLKAAGALEHAETLGCAETMEGAETLKAMETVEATKPRGRDFLVSTKTGGFRPILDLHILNQCIAQKMFRTLTIKKLLELVQPGDLIVTARSKGIFHRTKLVLHFTLLGLAINWKRSIPRPHQQVEYLGVVPDSVSL